MRYRQLAAEQALFRSGQHEWPPLTVLFDYPPAIRRAIYATNAIESLHYSLRKATPPAALITANSLMFDGIRKMAIMSL